MAAWEDLHTDGLSTGCAVAHQDELLLARYFSVLSSYTGLDNEVCLCIAAQLPA